MSLTIEERDLLLTEIQSNARYTRAYEAGDNTALTDLYNEEDPAGDLFFPDEKVPMSVIMDNVLHAHLVDQAARDDFADLVKTAEVDYGLAVARNRLFDLFNEPSPSRTRLVALREKRQSFAEVILSAAVPGTREITLTLQDMRFILETAPSVGDR